MALSSNQVSVTNTATKLVASVSTSSGHDPGFGPTRVVVVINPAGQTVYLGSASVTTSTGLALTASSATTIWLYPDEELWGIVTSSTQTVSFLASGS